MWHIHRMHPLWKISVSQKNNLVHFCEMTMKEEKLYVIFVKKSQDRFSNFNSCYVTNQVKFQRTLIKYYFFLLQWSCCWIWEKINWREMRKKS